MATDRGMHKETPIGDLASVRLGPAETHEIIRQRLTRMAGRWGLEPADVPRLAQQMRARTYTPGEMIVPRGTRADCLGLVVRGQVAVHAGQRGATRLAVVLLPGSTFGEMMLDKGHPSSTTLRALTRSEIRFLRRAELQSLRDKRQKERQIASLWQVVRVSAVLLAALLVIVLALSQPAGRKALALVPMSIGQWCDDLGHEYCTWSAWRVAANLTPSDPNPYLALGTFHFGRGAIAEAEQSFEQARALAPDLPETYNNLGLIYARQGMHAQAIEAFQRSLELEPGIAATEHNLALSFQAMRNYDTAIEHYRAALALSEPQLSTLLNMAIAYYEAEQPDKAEEMTNQALRMDPNLAPAHTLLGALALEARKPEQALPHLHHAVSLDAGYSQAHFYLGLAYKSLDRSAEAIASFERALVNASDEVTRVRIRRHLGELYEAQDQGRAD
jgi:tetratricopeptide (TPR) repeat protein